MNRVFYALRNVHHITFLKYNLNRLQKKQSNQTKIQHSIEHLRLSFLRK